MPKVILLTTDALRYFRARSKSAAAARADAAERRARESKRELVEPAS